MYDFGFVSLDILYVYAEDSGIYSCRATNAHGEDTTTAEVRCKGVCIIETGGGGWGVGGRVCGVGVWYT